MKNNLIYKSHLTFLLPLIIIIFLLSFCPLLVFNLYLLIIYIIIISFGVCSFLLKRYSFYDDRVEISYVILRKKEVLYLDEIKEIQFRLYYANRSPPQILIITKSEPYNLKRFFVIFGTKKTSYLLNRLHSVGLEIKFLCDKNYIKKIKNW